MNNRKLYIVLALFILIVIFPVGCSYEPGSIDEKYVISLIKNTESTLAEDVYGISENNISVALPQSHTSIYINRLGYTVDDDKKAVFYGDKLGDTFNVVRADTKETVYTGDIQGDNYKTGDFSSVTEPGEYYIETDYVGRSYNFTISDNGYTELFDNLSNGFYSQAVGLEEGILDACFGMNAVIYAMHCNSDVFGAESNIVEQLLRMSDGLISLQESDGSMQGDYESTAAFCGIMAMCDGEFGKYESLIDVDYKDCALKAWEWLESEKSEADNYEAAMFYAASQLYGLTGGEDYKSISERYLNDKDSGYSDDPFTFYGAIAYMDSKEDVDMTLCTYIMMDMITKADKICDSVSDDKVFRVGVSDIDDVMTDTVEICFFNYLVPSSEYISVLTGAIDYVGGYNPDGVDYLEMDNVGKYYEYKSIMIFALSSIINS